MRRAALVIGVTLAAVFFCLSCGGGGGDGGGAGSLEGVWYGVVEDGGGDAETLRIQLDGSGNIVDVQVGGVSINDTGHLNEDWDENLFHFRYDYAPGHSNPFSSSIMIVDDSARCAMYSDRSMYFAVLEKGATSLPSYAASDIVGSFAGGGYEFAFDPSEGSWNWGGEAVSMTVDLDLTFSGSSTSDSFTGGFNDALHSGTYGGYSGTLTRVIGPPKNMNINALVSPGKSCVAAWAWETGTNPISNEDFILIGLVK